MKKFIIILLAAAASFWACGNKEDGPDDNGNNKTNVEITVDFTISVEKALTGEEVTFTSNVSGGKEPYAYVWSFNEEGTSTEANPKYTFDVAGIKVISLNVTDADGNKPARPKSKTFQVEDKPIEDTGDLKLTWYCLFGDKGGGVRGSSPAIDDEGNIYIVSSLKDSPGHLRKVSSEGKLLASVQFAGTGNSCMSPTIDAAGNIYAGGGSVGGGVVRKYDKNLSMIWDGEFWNKGDAPNPKIWYGYTPVIEDKAVLVVNAGSAGTLGALSIADGKRFSWQSNLEGTNLSGGCRQAPAVSKDGFVWQVYAKNGVCGAELSPIINAVGASPATVVYNTVKLVTDAAGSQFSLTSADSDRLQMAVVTVDGTTYGAGLTYPEGDPATIYLIDKTGNGKGFYINETNTSIANTVAQDQGGVIISPDNEVVVNLKSGAEANGGIVAINPKTMTLSWEFRIAESVSGAPAYTKEGNVVFGTDKGSFYVIKPTPANKGAELLAKADITALAVEAGMTFDSAYENPNIKMWSSVTVGDDGKLYIGFQKADTQTESGLLCLTTKSVTGPGAGSWPMFGVDRKHSGVQR